MMRSFKTFAITRDRSSSEERFIATARAVRTDVDASALAEATPTNHALRQLSQTDPCLEKVLYLGKPQDRTFRCPLTPDPCYMFKIGDFSRLGQVSVRMLRHYDDLDLLKPAYIDRFTGYRYYTIEQLPRLNRILALKDLGIPLEKITDLLQQNLPIVELQNLLRSKQIELEEQIQADRSRLNRLSARLDRLEREGQTSTYDAILKSVPTYSIASIRQIVPFVAEMPKYRCLAIDRLDRWLKAQNILPIGSEVVLYHASEYTETNIDMEFGIAIPAPAKPIGAKVQDGTIVRQLPACDRVASVFHSGMIQNVTQAIVALFSWIDANGYVSNGAIREIHLFGAETVLVRDEPVTIELQIPLA